MEVIIAKHIVKPSSPTPNTSKLHKLSFLDQMAPPFYIPFIFLYQNDQSKLQQEEISRRLKQSLSEILTIFYPLAGRIKQNSFVDCNDAGAEFIETLIHTRLAQFTQNPKMEELEKLLPANTLSYKDDAVQLLVKATFFDCGGVAVGVCLSHKLADAASCAAFVSAWAAACRGEGSRITRPSFDLASYFPARESRPASDLFFTIDKITARRLIFDKARLEKLRALSPNGMEAVSAFILRSFIEAGKAESPSPEKWSCAALVLRRIPQMPVHAFGNSVKAAAAVVSPEEGGGGVLVSKLRAAVTAAADGNVMKEREVYDLIKSGGYCLILRLLWFGLYEVDFGWGKPVWWCMTTVPVRNLVHLTETASGDGIEAWVNVSDHHHHRHFFQLLQLNFSQINAFSRI